MDFKFSVPPAVRQRLVSVAGLNGFTELWSLRFQKYFARPFRVCFHNNTSTMISSRIHKREHCLRLHHMFLEADGEVLKALACYLRGARRGDRRLDRFIEKNLSKVRRKKISGGLGRRFDLEAIRDAINRVYFDSPVEIPVVWGTKSRSAKRRSIRLGSYSFEDRFIRIHPALDQPFVPAYVVVGVMYHEMLHHALGSQHRNGKQLVHTQEFRQKEARFVHHRRVEAWIQQNLRRLLKRSP